MRRGLFITVYIDKNKGVVMPASTERNVILYSPLIQPRYVISTQQELRQGTIREVVFRNHHAFITDEEFQRIRQRKDYGSKFFRVRRTVPVTGGVEVVHTSTGEVTNEGQRMMSEERLAELARERVPEDEINAIDSDAEQFAQLREAMLLREDGKRTPVVTPKKTAPPGLQAYNARRKKAAAERKALQERQRQGALSDTSAEPLEEGAVVNDQ